MPSRRPLALVAAVLLLCVPVLSSCGFNKATERPYTQADGTNHKTGSVFVLNAVIAAGQSDSGTLIASLSNQTDSSTETLESVAGGAGNTITAADFSPIAIKPMGFVNLADDDVITLTGSFDAGDIIPLSLEFANGSTISLDVPVVYACQAYAGLDVSQSSASPTESAASPSTGGTKVAPTTAPTAISPIAPTDDSSSAASTEGATPSPSDTTEPSSVASPTSYTCGTDGGTGGKN